jgi:hypothetical protein
MKNKQLQQGDVLLALVSKLPANCKKIAKDNRGVVLAEGEHTGHYHGIEEDAVCLMEAPDGTRFLVNEGELPVTINHQEHKPVTVDPGIWAIGIVIEHDYFADMVRNVVD